MASSSDSEDSCSEDSCSEDSCSEDSCSEDSCSEDSCSEDSELSQFSNVDELKTALRSCLEAVDSGGSFATSGRCDTINPGLVVDGLGSFGLPLSEPEAQRLIGSSRQAPFGKGSETIVDTAVRNTWEIDASRLKLCNPKWPETERRILDKVCQGLGVHGGVTYVAAQLYKLLIYQEGAMFKPHKDTEKTPRMFGTMVICLPSLHTGGDLVASFNGKNQVHSSSLDSEWLGSFTAWYADVLHEVKPILSGYRVVLTYNLVHTGPSVMPGLGLKDQEKQSDALRTILSRWSTDGDMHEYLVYILDHEYTDANLRLDHLKGEDRKRIGALARVCHETDFVLYFSLLEKTVSGSVEDGGYGYGGSYGGGGTHEIDEVYDESLSLTKVFELDGTELATSLRIHEDAIVQESPFEDRDPDDEDFEGWTGNEGASSTHWYRDAAIVIIPRHLALDFLFRSHAPFQSISRVIQSKKRALMKDRRNGALQQDLVAMCMKMNDKFPGAEHKAFFAGIALELGCLDLLEHTIRTYSPSTAGPFPPRVLDDLCTALRIHGFAAVKPRHVLDAAARHYNNVGGRFLMTQYVSDRYEPAEEQATQAFTVWKESTLESLLLTVQKLVPGDAPLLVMQAHDRQRTDWISKTLIPAICRAGTNAPFAIALGRALREAIKAHKLDRENAASICEESYVIFQTSNGLLRASFLNLSANDLIEVHQTMLELGMLGAEDKLLQTLRLYSDYLSLVDIKNVVFPYISYWLNEGRNSSGPSGIDRYRETFGILLKKSCAVLCSAGDETASDLLQLYRLLREVRMQDTIDDLLRGIQTVAAINSPEKLDNILLPFLKGMAEYTRDTTADFVEHEQQYDVTVRAVVQQYFKRALPQEPRRFPMARKGCGYCPQCHRLDTFLMDPSRKIDEYEEYKKARDHIKSRVERQPGLTVSEARDTMNRNLQKVVVTKTNGEYEHLVWQGRAREMKMNVLDIASYEKLTQLLGGEPERQLERLARGEPLQLYGPTTLAPIAQEVHSASRQLPSITEAIAGSKRKYGDDENDGQHTPKRAAIDIVDLT